MVFFDNSTNILWKYLFSNAHLRRPNCFICIVVSRYSAYLCWFSRSIIIAKAYIIVRRSMFGDLTSQFAAGRFQVRLSLRVLTEKKLVDSNLLQLICILLFTSLELHCWILNCPPLNWVQYSAAQIWPS